MVWEEEIKTMKEEVSWEEFVKKYSSNQDHLHLAVAICEGQKGVDPMLLCENTEIPTRHAIKFPGTRFDSRHLTPGLLTKSIERNLESFGFDKKQYKNLIRSYKEDDEITFSHNNFFIKSEYLSFFKKVLTLVALEKTGLLIELEEKPFYIDEDENENNPELKAYRIFFEAKKFKKPPADNKKFFKLKKSTIRLLHANDYNKIIEIVEKNLKERENLQGKLLLSYWQPLIKYLKGP